MTGYVYGASPEAVRRREGSKQAELAAASAAAARAAATEAALNPTKGVPRTLTALAAERIDLSHLPVPVWGGPLGLRLAVAEAADWEKRNPQHPLTKESSHP